MATIKEAKESIKNGVKAYLYKEDGQYVMQEVNRLPFYLEGPPGVGKTEIVKQIADELGIGYVSFSLVHHTRNTLLGLPVITELQDGEKYTRYTMSEIIAQVLEEKQKGVDEGILLLDEFPCVSDTVLPTMLAFLQTKNIGKHTLPEGWVIVLCGNPPKYNRSARKLDGAILDRVRKIVIQFNPDVFMEYAADRKVHPSILMYLGVNKKNIYYLDDKEELNVVTARSWENLSQAMYVYDKLGIAPDEVLIRQYIKNDAITRSFDNFYKIWYAGLSQSDFDDIAKGKNVKNIDAYMKLPIKAKWMIEELLVNNLESRYKGTIEAMESVKKTEKLYDTLKKRMSEESFFNSIFEVFLEENDGERICKRLGVEEIVDSELMNNIYKCIRPELPMWSDSGAVDKIGMKALKKWINALEKQVEKELSKVAGIIENTLCFLEGIDKQRVLAQKYFNEINKCEAYVVAMSKSPKELYTKYCKEKYGIV